MRLKLYFKIILFLFTSVLAFSTRAELSGITGVALATCKGRFTVYTMTYYEMGQKDTGDTLNRMSQLTDNIALSRQLIIKSEYDFITNMEMQRFAPMARQNVGGGVKQAQAELKECINFLNKMK
jgi:hypothetical protein